jgi:uncharacterized protein (DUF2267 family)
MAGMDDRYLIDESAFIARIRDLGLADDFHAAHAARSALAALGECLPAPERTAFLAALPPPLARSVAAYRGQAGADQLFDRVREHEDTNAGFAREHAEIVCRVLGEMLPEELTFRLQRAFEPSVAALFESLPAPSEPPPYGIPHGERHHTLATGVPGSRHPISDAPPPGAQSESVVRAQNPHGDRKLSSSHGLTQEQTDESLSTEVPRTERTIAESHD